MKMRRYGTRAVRVIRPIAMVAAAAGALCACSLVAGTGAGTSQLQACRRAYAANDATLRIQLLAADLEFLSKGAFEADATALQELKASREELRKILRLLRDGGRGGVLKSRADERGYVSALDDMDADMKKVEQDIAVIDASIVDVTAAQAAANRVVTQMPGSMAAQFRLAEAMVDANEPASQLMVASRQVVLNDRLTTRIWEILEGGAKGLSAADAARRDKAVWMQVSDGLLGGNAELGLSRLSSPAERRTLKTVMDLQAGIDVDVDAVLSRSRKIHDAWSASNDIGSVRFRIMNRALDLNQLIDGDQQACIPSD